MKLVQIDFAENVVSPVSTDTEYTMVRTLRGERLELSVHDGIVTARDKETGNVRCYPWSKATSAVPAPPQSKRIPMKIE